MVRTKFEIKNRSHQNRSLFDLFWKNMAQWGKSYTSPRGDWGKFYKIALFLLMKGGKFKK